MNTSRTVLKLLTVVNKHSRQSWDVIAMNARRAKMLIALQHPVIPISHLKVKRSINLDNKKERII